MKSVATKEMKLMKSQTKMKCCELRTIFLYHESNKILYPEKFAHYLLLLIHLFTDQTGLLSDCPPSCQKSFYNLAFKL